MLNKMQLEHEQGSICAVGCCTVASDVNEEEAKPPLPPGARVVDEAAEGKEPAEGTADGQELGQQNWGQELAQQNDQ